MKVRFPFATITGVVLTTLVASGMVFWMVDDSEAARHHYHQLLQMAKPANVKHESTSYIAKQQREGIQKSLYFMPAKENTLHELRLFASSSELMLVRKEDSQISEKLEDFRAMVQESFYYANPDGKSSLITDEVAIPMQNITYLSSETANCCYTQGTLVAHKGEMTRFILPGRLLIDDLESANIHPYQSASAENIHLRYKEGLLLLDGDVMLDHHEGEDLLQLTCDTACLYEENKAPVVEAKAQVKIVFNYSLTATGDSAYFEGDEVSLFGDKKENRCLLCSKEGDQIYSDRIQLSLKSRIVQMQKPAGILYPVKGEFLPLKFSSHQLLWNHDQNELVLEADVAIFHPTLGRLTNQNTVHIFRSEKKENTLEKMISKGHTVLTRHEPQTGRVYTLTCDGNVVLDHIQGEVFLTAADPVNAPVYLNDEFGKVYADTAKVYYSPSQSRQKAPQKIVLQGNVKIMNRNAPAGDAPAVVQMALADKIELNPATNEMVFFASQRKRVLFYEESNELQISAPRLTVRRDRQTRKESFEGDGDVRFSFQDKEITELRKKFSLPFNKEDKP